MYTHEGLLNKNEEVRFLNVENLLSVMKLLESSLTVKGWNEVKASFMNVLLKDSLEVRLQAVNILIPFFQIIGESETLSFIKLTYKNLISDKNYQI